MIYRNGPQFDDDDDAYDRVTILTEWLGDHIDDDEARGELNKWVWVLRMGRSGGGK